MIFKKISKKWMIWFLSACLLFVNFSAYAILKTEVAMMTQKWGLTLEAGNLKLLESFYDSEAYIYPSLQNYVISTPQDRTEYLEKLTSLKQLTVKFEEQHVRIFVDTAINSGLMSLSYNENNKHVIENLRFTFVYAKKTRAWLIVEQHFSLLPEKNALEEQQEEQEEK